MVRAPDDDDAGTTNVSPNNQPHPLDEVANSDLGPRSRYSALDMDTLRWDLETAFATPASEDRDRKAAAEEFLRMAAKVLDVACHASSRQGLGGNVWVGENAVALVLDDGRSLLVEHRVDDGVLRVGQAWFGYAARSWTAPFGLEGIRGDIDPIATLVDALKRQAFSPGLAELRTKVRGLQAGCESVPAQPAVAEPPVFGRPPRGSDIDGLRDRKRQFDVILELQRQIKEMLGRMRPEARVPAEEDSWTMPDAK